VTEDQLPALLFDVHEIKDILFNSVPIFEVELVQVGGVVLGEDVLDGLPHVVEPQDELPGLCRVVFVAVYLLSCEVDRLHLLLLQLILTLFQCSIPCV